jgi:UDP-N-acetyl-D-glucosamine dehydrogenase
MAVPRQLKPIAKEPQVGDSIAAVQARRARVGIIGLGYVGMPLALTAAKAGFPVIGFDVDAIECSRSIAARVSSSTFLRT